MRVFIQSKGLSKPSLIAISLKVSASRAKYAGPAPTIAVKASNLFSSISNVEPNSFRIFFVVSSSARSKFAVIAIELSPVQIPTVGIPLAILFSFPIRFSILFKLWPAINEIKTLLEVSKSKF